VYGGIAIFDRAAETLARYREWALDEPGESNTALVVMTGRRSRSSRRRCAAAACSRSARLCLDDAENAERVLAPLWRPQARRR
jgi:hypothetical protein